MPPSRARIVYSDLDGTMVGPKGCFFRDETSELTLEPARALVDLLAAGVTLVLVSGRTREQLVEAARVFGADGFVGELGAVVAWDSGRSSEVLTGAMPVALLDGRGGTADEPEPAAVIEATGVVGRLLERHAGFLEYHSPWHLGHATDVMLRGRVDVALVEAELAEEGFGWLRLRDNGVLPPRRPTSLHADAMPAHVYHLMPDGLDKGLGVARDLARRGLSREQAVAIGDSASDLEMAPYVDQLWLTANGARNPHMPELAAAHDNVVVADQAVGLGWVQAVRAALSPRTP